MILGRGKFGHVYLIGRKGVVSFGGSKSPFQEPASAVTSGASAKKRIRDTKPSPANIVPLWILL